MKRFFIPFLAFLGLFPTLFAQQITRQGFELSTDSWAFAASPTTYNVFADADVWDDTTATAQMTAADGQRFWFLQDLENPNGGSTNFHTLDFAPIDVSAFSNNTLTFKFQTLAYDLTDSIGYIVAFNNSAFYDKSKLVLLPPNTAAWQTVLINVPAGSSHVRLRLMAKQNGGSDFAGFDEIVLSSSAGDQVAPQVLSAKTTAANSILLVFSEVLEAASAQNLANFTGIAGLSAAQLSPSGDSVRLVFSQNFQDGAAQKLTVSTGVKDAAGNSLALPFDHNFIWNGGQPALVVTEIMYNNPAADTLEFFEIYNFGAAAASIGGLRVEGSVQFEFPEMTVQKGETVLLALEKAKAESFFVGKIFLDWSNGALGNGDGTIRILNSANAVLDEVIYDDAAPWPLEPDGLGPSLELISPNLDNALGQNWKASTDAFGTMGGIFATPGTVKIVTVPTVSFKKTSTLFNEKSQMLRLEVTTTAAPSENATVEIRLNPFSKAVEGVDYIQNAQFLTFPKDSAGSQFIEIEWLGNALADGSRYLMVEISNPEKANLGANSSHLILANDDDAKAPTATSNGISMRHLGSFRVDTTATPSAEISAFEPISKRLFATNALENTLEIIDFRDPYALKKIAKINLKPFGGGPNSVVALQGFVAVAIEDSMKMGNGRVAFFYQNGGLVNSVEVGNLPDNLVLSPDGKLLVTANEGEPSADYLIDPEGSVSIINVEPGVLFLTQANVATLNFQSFNGSEAAIRAQGGRIFGPSATVAKDLEPEYVAISDDSKKAFVTCQENNALAVVNLETFQIESLTGLGLKDWSAFSMDASDRTGGIFSNRWPIKGVFMPDAADFFTVGGQGFLLTANEGDAREYSAYAELRRVGDAAFRFDSTAFPDAALLKNQNLLGRLTVTTASGDTDGDGDFDEIHAFGSRSITIWDAATGARVWDSGDDFERITASDPVFSGLFNASNANNTLKNRSDDKGPEPESALVAQIEGRQIAFAGLERVGGIMAYDVTEPTAPKFLQYINTRASSGSAASGDLGPEGLLFVPKSQSPNGRDLLVVSNESSGSVGVFEIGIDRTKTGEFSSRVFELKSSEAIGVYGDTIREGGFSGLHFLAGTDDEFLIVSDRGPNAAATASPLAAGQNALVFPFPSYSPKVFRAKAENGEIKILETKSLKRPDGTGVSGLPLPVGQGNTGEVAWSDTLATVVSNDVWGLDTEGIVEDNDGHIWLCEEYGSAVFKAEKATGRIVQRFSPWPTQPEDFPLDSLIGKRRANRGFEGIAYTPNGRIFAILQSPVNNPTAAAGNVSRLHRLIEIDPKTGAMRTFAYEHDAVLGAIRSQDWKIGDLAAINNDEFLLLEHAERNGWNAKNIYKISLVGATPVVGNDFGGKTLEQLNTAAGAAAAGIQTVQKTLFADLLELGWDRSLDKPEGLTILNDSTFAVGNDNDFGIDAPALDGKIKLTGKKSKLYIIGVSLAKKLNYVSPYCQTAISGAAAACASDSAEVEAAGVFVDFGWSNGAVSAPTAAVAAGETVFLTAVNAAGCTARDTFSIGILAKPTVDLGVDKSICPDFSTVLAANAQPSGSLFKWSNGAATSEITVSTAGAFVLTATNADGCAASDTVQVILLPEPTVDLGADKIYCPGVSVVLKPATQPAGSVFLWNYGQTSSQLTAISAGPFALTVTNSAGCAAADTANVIAGAFPTVNLGPDTLICEGKTLTLAAPAAASYLWSNGATTTQITVSTKGNYAVTATSADGCSASDLVFVDVQICISTKNEAEIGGLRLFPNPTTGLFSLQMDLKNATRADAFLTDATGRRVKMIFEKAIFEGQNRLEIDGSDLPNGLYFLTVRTEKGSVSRRVVVARD